MRRLAAIALGAVVLAAGGAVMALSTGDPGEGLAASGASDTHPAGPSLSARHGNMCSCSSRGDNETRSAYELQRDFLVTPLDAGTLEDSFEMAEGFPRAVMMAAYSGAGTVEVAILGPEGEPAFQVQERALPAKQRTVQPADDAEPGTYEVEVRVAGRVSLHLMVVQCASEGGMHGMC